MTAPAVKPDDEDLDAACLRMRPIARRFLAAVSSRDKAAMRAAWKDVYGFVAPLGRSPLIVLVLVLADELIVAEATPVDPRVSTAATRAERARCLELARAILTGPPGNFYANAQRLPARIASGDRP